MRNFDMKEEITNLGRGSSYRRNSLCILQKHIQNLHMRDIQQFIENLYLELQENGPQSVYIVSLHEIFAQNHGANLVPYIDSIMKNLLHAICCKVSPPIMHDACAHVVESMVRYMVDVSSRKEARISVITRIAKPLLEVLLGYETPIAQGAAHCLESLVRTNAWKNDASHEIVDEMCLKVAGALLENATQTVSHLRLVSCLAMSNSQILEPYCRSLMGAATIIIDSRGAKGDSRLRFIALQTIIDLLKHVDVEYLEVDDMVLCLQRWLSDSCPSVRHAAYQALQIYRWIVSDPDVNHVSPLKDLCVIPEDDAHSFDEEDYDDQGYSPSLIPDPSTGRIAQLGHGREHNVCPPTNGELSEQLEDGMEFNYGYVMQAETEEDHGEMSRDKSNNVTPKNSDYFPNGQQDCSSFQRSASVASTSLRDEVFLADHGSVSSSGNGPYQRSNRIVHPHPEEIETQENHLQNRFGPSFSNINCYSKSCNLESTSDDCKIIGMNEQENSPTSNALTIDGLTLDHDNSLSWRQITKALTSSGIKAVNLLENTLKCILCIELAIPFAMVVIKHYTLEEDFHFMAPT